MVKGMKKEGSSAIWLKHLEIMEFHSGGAYIF